MSADVSEAVERDEVERLSKVYAEATGYYVQFHRGLSSPSSDAIRKGIRAVLAALQEESGALPASPSGGQWQPIETAPRDGRLFIARNADHPSFGSHAMQRMVRLSFTLDGEPVVDDLGAWLILRGNEHDYLEGSDLGPEPIYSVAADDLNTSVRYEWMPLPDAPAMGMEAFAEGRNAPQPSPEPRDREEG